MLSVPLLHSHAPVELNTTELTSGLTRPVLYHTIGFPAKIRKIGKKLTSEGDIGVPADMKGSHGAIRTFSRQIS